MKRVGRFLQDRVDHFPSSMRLYVGRAKKAIRRGTALLWSRTYWVSYSLADLKSRHGAIAGSLVLLLLIGVSVYWAPTVQGALEPYFAANERLSGLRLLLLTLGGALIGATAIAFSLVMFAMQVNVERMPHGLFRKLSSDRRLLGAFTCTFLLAIAVTVLSIIPGKSWPWLVIATMGAGWGALLILLLFLYAYRRAISLINPLQQLVILVDNARREMRNWDRRAHRVAPLLESRAETISKQTPLLDVEQYLPRLAFFQLNPHWTDGARQAILHAVSFARRFAEQGDHEVSAAALSVIVQINAAYVEVKRKTFFSIDPFFYNPLATDVFIDETLEHLRQNVRVGLSRGDEQLIEQTFKTLAQLVLVYLKIDYADKYASKTHAQLAAGYLSKAVRSVVPHDMPDVIMEGLRLMGKSAQSFLVHANVDDITTITDNIALVALAGAYKEDYRPITLTGVEQLAKLTFDLILVNSQDIRFAVGELKKSVATVAKLFLDVPETPLPSIHSSCLAPYYSGMGTQTLQAWLANLVNALVKAKENDEQAQTIIGNIEKWADRLFQAEKELLLLAIEKKSYFTLDMIHWIANITKILLAISNAPACDDRTRERLRKHALWLVSVLSWIPDDQETVVFVENFQVTETLFKAAMDAYQRNCIEVSDKICDLLLSWAFKAGKYQSRWAIFERAMYGLATLVVFMDDIEKCDKLKATISKRLEEEGAPTQEIRDRAARDIRRRSATLYRETHGVSHIENAMSQVDHEKLRSLLEDIANLLFPETRIEA